STSSTRSSPPAASANGCHGRLPPSSSAARCTSSRAAAFRGSRSTFPRITGARAARCCRPSRPRRPWDCRTRRPLSARPNTWGEPSVMYERFYNLRERPFSLSPDPDYLYPSRVHREALSYLRYGIEGHAGFIVITGEIGSGKTTLLQTALRSLDHQTSVSRIVNTMLDARELLEAVMLDFGLDPGVNRSKPLLLRDLAHYLVEQRRAGRLALLVIDEAQNLSLAALEEVRMLSNLETEKSKLIQIALIGQPNLRDLLMRPELEQLRQRVTVSYHLQPLDSADTAAYVNHRLKRAAMGAPLEFSRDVTDLIHLHSEGIPRKINVIADAVLLFGYGEEQHTITVDLTQEAIEELEATGVIQPSSRARGVVSPRLATAVREEDLLAREAQLAERERQIAE